VLGAVFFVAAAVYPRCSSWSRTDRSTSTEPRERRDGDRDDRPERSHRPATARAEIRLPNHVIRGVCLAHNWQEDGVDGYGSETSRATVDHLADLGVDAVSLTPFAWMSDVSSPVIRGEHNSDEIPEGAESRARLRRMVDQANERGMRTVLKPHIWIRGGKWRGAIDPVDDGEPAWESWWESYRAFIHHYARLAADLEVDTLVVGVELVSAIEARPDQFKRTIDSVRSRFDGHLTYGANWDEDLPDDIWRRLDSIGLQFYAPLTERTSPDVDHLREAVRRELDPWVERANRLDRPLDILEVGYKSADSAVQKPFGWPENLPESERTQNLELQKRAYRALFAELSRTPSLRSIYVWKYFTDPTRDEGGPSGFSPRGKPAEEILRRAYRPRSPHSESTAPETEVRPKSP